MVCRLAAAVGLAMTLVLPIYPQGLTPMIIVFGGVALVGGLWGLLSRSARCDLIILAPWFVALLGAFFVGAFAGAPPRQAVEDSLPYGLFALGLLAGRGASAPHRVLLVALVACVLDAAASLYRMPSLGEGVRSTYTYFKITAGLPLVGLYLAAMLRPASRRRGLYWLASLFLLVAVAASVSRGMILAAALGVVVAAYVRKPSQLLGVATLALGGVVLYSANVSDFVTTHLRLDQPGTIEGRLREVRLAWASFADNPLLGVGLGAELEVDGHLTAFVHNAAAYHLWKFGIVGSILLVLPVWLISRPLRRGTRAVRAAAIGGAFGVGAYLVTCAAYKTYYLVWVLGVVLGASLNWAEARRQR